VAKATSQVDPARSAQMALVRSSNTKPELRVRKALHAAGLRFRLHDRRLPGRPDIVLPSRRVAVFVHGCFWHRHPDPACKLARMPKSRLDFWEAKLTGNAERDARTTAAVRAAGWTPVVLWECETQDPEALSAAVARIAAMPRVGPAVDNANKRGTDTRLPPGP
jgi:DNA mismatch endonuclease (patch repair protein)